MEEFGEWLKQNRPIILSISALDSPAFAVYHFSRYSFWVGKIKVVIQDGENRVTIPTESNIEKLTGYIDGWRFTKGNTEIEVVAN